MKLKRYNELIQREQQLQGEMKDFIIDALKASGGHITYVSPDMDNEELTLDDKYPVISTLWGKHGTYNVAITDVYTMGQDVATIYVDGIEQETESKQDRFQIYPEQFSDILHFIMSSFNEKVRIYAERLALKDLVDKYDKLPHELYSESGGIKHEYHSENWDNIKKYTSELEEIYIRCSEPDSNKHDINSDLMSIISELADLALIEQNQLLIDNMTEDCDGEIRFTEDKQDEFNDLYDEIEGQLWELMNFEGID